MTTRPFNHVHLLIAGLLATLLAATTVRGQGTNGVFPEPMDWQAFQKLAQPLDLTSEQLSAIEAVHGQYLQEMMTLRNGSIAVFMEDERSIHVPGPGAEQEEVRDRVSDYKAIHRRIDSTESNFFDALVPALGPSQQERLHVARDWRERQRRLESTWPWIQFAPSMRRVQLEIRPMVSWSRLSPQDSIEVEAHLANWEATRTRLVRDLFKQRLEGWARERALDAERGPVALGNLGDDPEAGWAAYRQEQLDRHRIAYEDALKTVNKLRIHTSRGIQAIATLLPDRSGRDLTWRYWTRGYGITSGPGIRNLIVKTIRNPPSEDIDVQAVEALLLDHDQSIRPHARKIITLIDEDDDTRGATFFYSVDESEESPLGIEMAAIRKRGLADARRLQALLGGHTPEMFSKWLAEVDELEGTPSEAVPSGESSVSISIVVAEPGDEEDLEGGGGFFGTTGAESEAMEMFGKAPQPLTPDEIELLVSDLGIDEDGRDIVDVLYETYSKNTTEVKRSFDSSQRNAMIKMAAQAGAAGGGDHEVFIEMEATMDRIQKKARSDMEQLDGRLFEDLVLAVERAEDQVILRWHRQARQRSFALGSGGMMNSVMDMMGGAPNRGWRVDLMLELGRANLEPDARRTGLEALRSWHEPSTEAIIRHAEVEQQVSELMNGMIALQMGDRDSDEFVENTRQYMARMTELQEEQLRLKDEQLQRNMTTIDVVTSALPVADAQRLRTTYRVASYPVVYEDPHAMTDHLLASSRLEDLDEATRGSIHELQTEYDQQYNQYCLQLVEVFENMPSFRGVGFSMDHVEEHEKKKREADRIRFQRDDYSDKVRDKLRNLLTEEQVAAIGGLKPATTTTMHWPQF